MSRLLIIGSGGQGKVVLDCAVCLGAYESIAFATNEDNQKAIGEYSLLDERTLTYESIKTSFDAVVVAIGDNAKRLTKVKELLAYGITLPLLVHPSATVSAFATLGAGTVVFAQAVVNPFAQIGIGGIINTGAIVEHDCRLGDGVHLSPRAAIGGATVVGDRTWLGIGSCVSDHVVITTDVIVGAGAAVVGDLRESGVYVGVPARYKSR